MTQIKSTYLLYFLGIAQVALICDALSETVVWLTARLFQKHDLYLAGTAKFTKKGMEVVKNTSDAAFFYW
jgi:hypothetical protein